MNNPWPDGIIPPGVHDISETILIDHPYTLALHLRGAGPGFVDRAAGGHHGIKTSSCLNWTGPPGGTVLKVLGGFNVSLENFSIHLNGAAVGLRLSARSGTNISAGLVNSVFVYGDMEQPAEKQIAFHVEPEPGYPQIDTTEFYRCLVRDADTGIYQSGPADRTDAQIVGMSYVKCWFHNIREWCMNIHQGDAAIDKCNWAERSPASFVRFGGRTLRSSVTRCTVEMANLASRLVLREVEAGEGPGMEPLLLAGNRINYFEPNVDFTVVDNQHEAEVRILQDTLTGISRRAIYKGNVEGLDTVVTRGPEIAHQP